MGTADQMVKIHRLAMKNQKKALIDKACKWLREKNKMCMYELEMILGNKFIDDFKKAMEE